MSILNQTRNIHAVGLNYTAHIEEMGSRRQKEPLLFGKSPSCLSTEPKVHFPASLGEIHHEAELILRMGKSVPLGTFRDLGCLSHIYMGIDFTARALQTHCKKNGLPWHRAKSFRHAAWVAPVEKEADPHNPLTFHLEVNGKTRQQGDTRKMIHGFEEILGYINRTFDLHEGDLVYTGTPSGVGPVVNGDTVRVVCPQLDTDQTVAVRID